MIKRLYKCEGCFAFYEDKERASNCCNQIITPFIVDMSKRLSCNKNYRHLFTNKQTGQRISHCYYCGKKKEANG